MSFAESLDRVVQIDVLIELVEPGRCLDLDATPTLAYRGIRGDCGQEALHAHALDEVPLHVVHGGQGVGNGPLLVGQIDDGLDGRIGLADLCGDQPSGLSSSRRLGLDRGPRRICVEDAA